MQVTIELSLGHVFGAGVAAGVFKGVVVWRINKTLASIREALVLGLGSLPGKEDSRGR
jgi:hypothetical protein